jgi:hypothetical protein
VLLHIKYLLYKELTSEDKFSWSLSDFTACNKKKLRSTQLEKRLAIGEMQVDVKVRTDGGSSDSLVTCI